MRRLLLPILLAIGLVTIPLGLASTTAVSATGVIAGSGTAYTLTITNTGDQPITEKSAMQSAEIRRSPPAPTG